MPWVIIIIGAIVFFSYIFSSSSTSNASSSDHSQTAERGSYHESISSPQDVVKKNIIEYIQKHELYEKYKGYFESVLSFDKNIQSYKIDYLYESLQQDDLDEAGLVHYYIQESIRRGYPYYCVSEDEIDMLSGRYALMDHISPFRNYVPSIDSAIIFYTHQPLKRQYWIKKLLDLVRQGDMMSVSLLSRDDFHRLDPLGKGIVESVKNNYYDSFMEKVNQKDPHAILAYVHYNVRDNETAIKMLLDVEKEVESSDYYYELANRYRRMQTLDVNGLPREERNNNTLSESERSTLLENEIHYYYLGAKTNNGFMAGNCQFQIAWRYEDGETGFPNDPEKALFWYEKACENGYDCRFSIDLLKAKCQSD